MANRNRQYNKETRLIHILKKDTRNTSLCSLFVLWSILSFDREERKKEKHKSTFAIWDTAMSMTVKWHQN
jgi:hypothetical protein